MDFNAGESRFDLVRIGEGIGRIEQADDRQHLAHRLGAHAQLSQRRRM
jgi:hypothetical protein